MISIMKMIIRITMVIVTVLMYSWDMVFNNDNHEKDFEEDAAENHLGLLYLGALLADRVATFATE